MTRIFYLVMASLTLWAAAAQWLPREGLPTHLDFGPDQARAQSPSATSLFPSPPIVEASASQSVAAPGGVNAATASVVAPPPAATQVDAATTGFSQPPLSTTGPVAWQPQTQELENAKIVARVGGDVILAGEVLASVKGYLVRNKIDPNEPGVAEQVQQLVKMRLAQLIETKIVVNEAKRKIPAEGFDNAMKKFDEEFDKNVVPQMMKDRKIETVAQLETVLRAEGTTIEREKRAFAEQVLRNSWVSSAIKYDQEVTHEQMLAAYQQRLKDYEFAAQARWEQLSMRFDRFPSKAEAYAQLAQAGNAVVDGRPFADVAREMSQGSTAAEGGAVDWTTKGSLVSQPLDTAIFTLPVGTLSPIIEDERGFHIIRVVERKEAGRKPFLEVQGDISKKILEDRRALAEKKYLEDVRKLAVVWTIYDQPARSTEPSTSPTVQNAGRPTPIQR